jgi:hypothetical protein
MVSGGGLMLRENVPDVVRTGDVPDWLVTCTVKLYDPAVVGVP